MIDLSELRGCTFPGVYCIENTSNGILYYGSTKNIRKRAHEHASALRKGTHRNRNLQKDYSDGCGFSVHVVHKSDVASKKELLAAENFYIRKARIEGRKIYNEAIHSEGYTDPDWVVRRLADLYCREHMGVSLGNYLRCCPAEVEMKYKILFEPEKAEEIRKEYEEAINYQNKCYIASLPTANPV